MNEEYEQAVSDFVDALLAPVENDLFLEDFLPFQRKISRLGALNSLSQTLIKLTAPGRPRYLPGLRAVELQPGRSGQPSPGGL